MEAKLKKALARREWEETLLRFDSFSNEDALALGLKVVELAKERGAAVAVDITVNGTELFHYAMPGTNARNAMWIRRKENMVQVSQISSLRAGQYLQCEGKDLWKDWRLSDADYAAIGGGFAQIWRLFPFIVFFGLHPLANYFQKKYVHKTLLHGLLFLVKAVWFDFTLWVMYILVFGSSIGDPQNELYEVINDYILLFIFIGGTVFFLLYDYLMFKCQTIVNMLVYRIKK